MTFTYPNNHKDGLRLLSPVSISRNRLSFTMSSHHRTSAPPYRAVSYTWGDGEATERILINDQPFFVRLNLWSCLYYLGSEDTSRRTHLWVDAICINQADTQERNTQVRAMDLIYRKASSVAVWLGLHPDAEQYRYLDEPIRTFEVDPFDWWLGAEQLANRPYWGRSWVIQEFLLAQDVYLHCGNSRMHWSAFKDILGIQAGTAQYLSSAFDHRQHENGSWAAWPLMAGRNPDKHPEIQQPLYELLINHSGSQCKDPRDRVFSLLGLVTFDERPFLEQYFPDYTMSEDDVVIIALSYVRRLHLEYEWQDNERLFSGLGVTCEQRRKKLFKRAMQYDCLMGIPPSRFPFYEDDWGDAEPSWNEIINNPSIGTPGSPGRRWPWCVSWLSVVMLFVGGGLTHYLWKYVCRYLRSRFSSASPST